MLRTLRLRLRCLGAAPQGSDVDALRERNETLEAELREARMEADSLGEMLRGSEAAIVRMDALQSAGDEGYPSRWKHATIHLNPETGELHSDGDHSVRTWLEERLPAPSRRPRLQAVDSSEPESAAPRGGAVKAEPDKPEQALGGVTDER